MICVGGNPRYKNIVWSYSYSYLLALLTSGRASGHRFSLAAGRDIFPNNDKSFLSAGRQLPPSRSTNHGLPFIGIEERPRPGDDEAES